jgi:hypothetical protein
MRLTVEQQKVLNRVAKWSKCDCWFAVIDGYCYDLEKGRIPKNKRSTKNMVRMLWEGIVAEDADTYKTWGYIGLTPEEQKIFHDLLINLEIIKPFSDEYTMANPIMIGL